MCFIFIHCYKNDLIILFYVFYFYFDRDEQSAASSQQSILLIIYRGSCSDWLSGSPKHTLPKRSMALAIFHPAEIYRKPELRRVYSNTALTVQAGVPCSIAAIQTGRSASSNLASNSSALSERAPRDRWDEIVFFLHFLEALQIFKPPGH